MSLGPDLLILKKLFETTGADPIERLVRQHPSGIYARRIWFFYEWLTGARLGLPDATSGAYIDAIDARMQWDVKGSNSTRHRVRNNVPGAPLFAPLVRRTDYLVAAGSSDLSREAKLIVADVSRDVLARAAAFLLLKDSKSSFEIEGESPPQTRIQRWGNAISQAGKRPISVQELDRLQSIVLEPARTSSRVCRTTT